MANHYTDSSKNTDGKTIIGKSIMFTLVLVMGAVYKRGLVESLFRSAVQS